MLDGAIIEHITMKARPLLKIRLDACAPMFSKGQFTAFFKKGNSSMKLCKYVATQTVPVPADEDTGARATTREEIIDGPADIIQPNDAQAFAKQKLVDLSAPAKGKKGRNPTTINIYLQAPIELAKIV